MKIPTGNELYEFATTFWAFCLNSPNWVTDDIYLLSQIPEKKLTNARLAYAKYNPNFEKEILLTDNNIWFKNAKKGILLTSHYLHGKLDDTFVFDLSKIDTISIQGAFSSFETGILYVDNKRMGQITHNARSAIALRTFFQKLQQHEFSVDANQINHLLNPAKTSPFLMSLFQQGVSEGVLYDARENAIENESIIRCIASDSLIMTNFRLIQKYAGYFFRYESITKVRIQPKSTNTRTPPHMALLTKLIAKSASYLLAQSLNEYTVEFEIQGKPAYKMSSVSRLDAFYIQSILRDRDIKVEATFK